MWALGVKCRQQECLIWLFGGRNLEDFSIPLLHASETPKNITNNKLTQTKKNSAILQNSENCWIFFEKPGFSLIRVCTHVRPYVKVSSFRWFSNVINRFQTLKFDLVYKRYQKVHFKRVNFLTTTLCSKFNTFLFLSLNYFFGSLLYGCCHPCYDE